MARVRDAGGREKRREHRTARDPKPPVAKVACYVKNRRKAGIERRADPERTPVDG